MRRLTWLLVALVAAVSVAAAVFAGVLLWRSARTMTGGGTPTQTPAHDSTPIGVATGAIPSVLPPAPDYAGPAQGGIADPELKAQVWSTIVSFYTNVRGCADVASAGIHVSQEPDAETSWEETWDVSACSEAAALKIHFTVAPDGGIFYDIAE